MNNAKIRVAIDKFSLESVIDLLNTPIYKKTFRSTRLPMLSHDYILLLLLGTLLSAFAILLLIISVFTFELSINPISFLNPVWSWSILAIILVSCIFIFGYYYPHILSSGRKTQIELDLPYAITYMQSLSTTMTLYSIIKSIGQNSELYGEVSNECAQIVRDVDCFGDDLITAMRGTQYTTPSATFAELLNDLAMVFKTGGSMTSFFSAKSTHYRETAVQELENTLKTMEIMAEIYVTAFVAGPIAIMIMIVAQSLSGQTTIQYLEPLMYIGLPIGATLMIYILYLMMPADSLKVTGHEYEQAEYSDIPVDSSAVSDVNPEFLENLKKKKQMLQIKAILKRPLKYYSSDYQYSLVFGMFFAMIVALLYFNKTIASLFPTYPFEAFITITIIAFMAPIAFAYEVRNYSLRRIESQLPAFIRDISDMKDMGMTLQSAIHLIASSKIGVLTTEVKITSDEIKIGTNVSTALTRLEERIGLVSVKRAISLIVKASEITDSLREILAIAVGDLEHYLKMQNERFGVSFVYVAIIYLSYGIFLYSAYQLNVTFIESFAEFELNFNTEKNIGEMFHISIILGLVSGLMAGQLSANSILAGLKHSIIFMIAALILFIVVI